MKIEVTEKEAKNLYFDREWEKLSKKEQIKPFLPFALFGVLIGIAAGLLDNLTELPDWVIIVPAFILIIPFAIFTAKKLNKQTEVIREKVDKIMEALWNS